MNRYEKVLLTSAILAALACTSPAMAQQRKFEVPAQPAVTAIPELARQAQLQIIAPAGSLEGIQAPAIVGEMDAREALRLLLEGTGLEVKSDEGNIILLQKADDAAPERPRSGPQIGTGSLRGRVLNTATGEYVRNAEIRVEGTTLVTYSEDGGNFRLSGLPAGDVTVTVRYTGLQESKAVASVAAGQVSTLDFELKVPTYAGAGASGGGEAVEMDMIMVTAKREGQASAIMERRAAMNAKNVVAADNYGALTMGDVGEFMKSMPGISLDYTEVDATAVRIGGLDPKYSTFTIDGARMATATSNNNTGRQNSFEQMSITGIESIELNNTLTASMDADSPGGQINLRSKYAFNRTGRQIVAQLGGVGTSDSTLSRKYFPDDRKHSTLYPSAQFGFGDVFMEGRLGVEFNTSYNANYVQQDRIQTDWSYLADGRVMPYRVMWRPGPKMTSRTAANLSTDYQLTDELVLSLRSTYSFYDVEYFNQYTFLYFGTPTASYATPDSTPTHIVVNPNGNNTRLRTEYSHRYAGTPTYTIAPKLEFKNDTFEATLRSSYSRSEFNFRDNDEGFFQRTDSWLTGIGFTMDRPTEGSNAWTLAQTAGRPWGDPTSYNRDADIGNNVRTAQSDAVNDQYGAYLDLKKHLTIRDLPITLMGGFGSRSNDWRTNEGSYQQYQYVGPNGDLSQRDPAAVIPWTQHYQFGILGFDAGNMNQQNWRADNNYAVYDIYREHPEYFVADTVGNLKRRLDNNKRIQEQVDAAYIEAQTRIGKARFDLGLRYEKTRTAARVANVRPASEVTEAGLSVNTVEGLLYQYNNGAYSMRRGQYEDWFLSGGIKYDFTDRLVGQLAFSESILRPDYGNLGGVVSVNEDTMVVNVPNPLLKPEHSTKYFASLQYYLEPSGIVGLSYYKLDMKDMQVTGITVNPEDVGFDPDEYSGYTFRSAQNLPGTSTNEGLTLEYSQQLTFLPGAFRGLSLYGSYTKVNPDGERQNMPEQAANWGIRYNYGRFDLQINGNRQGTYRVSALSNTPTTANNGILYHTPRELWNISASYKLTENIELQLAGRNIFNEPDIIYSNVPGRVQQYTVYGSMWNFGIKARF
ncbi:MULTISPECIES: outer membrane beta-barrel protein [unclassified Pseudoxanthomonas]|uniref:outer membrane beta-barrel protein n=1 Tax=unclassified Pseudoxanthomonas TaxID=2645906 RepID=UPI00161B90E4|nr:MULTISPECIES: outer membrane beta-barrel protein [unclassified Pseudoxanthomonas]MBB3274233.1 TonB-dependent receptor [Pseudoxanthomonas sp. OG2]